MHEKYRLNFNIDEVQDDATIKKYKENINDFSVLVKKATSSMNV